MVGIVGPDGVGKSTLMALVAGSKKMQEGKVTVLGGDIADVRHRRAVGPRIAYMPQGLGKNLYLELSVHDNVDFMAQLFGLPAAERRVRVKELLDATGLGPFADRPAGKLSGGMKQKVGLCGALVHDPDLLILDEPTTGVDPLSRRQFWSLIDDIRAGRPGMSVVISTAYMDEAQRWDWIVAMDAGRVLATGTPAELMERTGTKDLEQCFIALLARGEAHGTHTSSPSRRAPRATGDRHRGARPDAPLRHLHGRRSRHAVDRARRDLRLPRLERLRQVDDDEDADRPAAAHRGDGDAVRQLRRGRQHGGPQEPRLHDAGVLALRRADRPPEPGPARAALSPAARQGEGAHRRSWSSGSASASHLDALAEELPMGLRQRLSLAVAVLHEPQILILDEPTSGVDPVARDSFWELLDRPLAQAGRHDLRDDPLHERGHALRPHLAHERGQGAGLRRARRS